VKCHECETEDGPFRPYLLTREKKKKVLCLPCYKAWQEEGFLWKDEKKNDQ